MVALGPPPRLRNGSQYFPMIILDPNNGPAPFLGEFGEAFLTATSVQIARDLRDRFPDLLGVSNSPSRALRPAHAICPRGPKPLHRRRTRGIVWRKLLHGAANRPEGGAQLGRRK